MILQKQIKTSKAIILVIGGLPEDAHNVCVQNYGQIFYLIDSKPKVGTLTELLEHCNWQPLGFLKDITEDVAKELVGELTQDNKSKYRNYKHEYGFKDDWWSSSFDTAIKSLHSLIETNCLLKNKHNTEEEYVKFVLKQNGFRYNPGYKSWSNDKYSIGTPIVLTDLSKEYREIWQQEQEKVFTNPFLLKKID